MSGNQVIVLRTGGPDHVAPSHLLGFGPVTRVSIGGNEGVGYYCKYRADDRKEVLRVLEIVVGELKRLESETPRG